MLRDEVLTAAQRRVNSASPNAPGFEDTEVRCSTYPLLQNVSREVAKKVKSECGQRVHARSDSVGALLCERPSEDSHLLSRLPFNSKPYHHAALLST
jgi:hypothetical protein